MIFYGTPLLYWEIYDALPQYNGVTCVYPSSFTSKNSEMVYVYPYHTSSKFSDMVSELSLGESNDPDSTTTEDDEKKNEDFPEAVVVEEHKKEFLMIGSHHLSIDMAVEETLSFSEVLEMRIGNVPEIFVFGSIDWIKHKVTEDAESDDSVAQEFKEDVEGSHNSVAEEIEGVETKSAIAETIISKTDFFIVDQIFVPAIARTKQTTQKNTRRKSWGMHLQTKVRGMIKPQWFRPTSIQGKIKKHQKNMKFLLWNLPCQHSVRKITQDSKKILQFQIKLIASVCFTIFDPGGFFVLHLPMIGFRKTVRKDHWHERTCVADLASSDVDEDVDDLRREVVLHQHCYFTIRDLSTAIVPTYAPPNQNHISYCCCCVDSGVKALLIPRSR